MGRRSARVLRQKTCDWATTLENTKKQNADQNDGTIDRSQQMAIVPTVLQAHCAIP
jgi:hypothetical protein